MPVKVHSAATKKKISNTQKKRVAAMPKWNLSEETKKKMSLAHLKHHADNRAKGIPHHGKNTKSITNGTETKRISKYAKIPAGWEKGFHWTPGRKKAENRI